MLPKKQIRIKVLMSLFRFDRLILLKKANPDKGFNEFNPVRSSSRVQRDLFDNKKHYLTHLLNPQSGLSGSNLVQRVDDFVSQNR